MLLSLHAGEGCTAWRGRITALGQKGPATQAVELHGLGDMVLLFLPKWQRYKCCCYTHTYTMQAALTLTPESNILTSQQQHCMHLKVAVGCMHIAAIGIPHGIALSAAASGAWHRLPDRRSQLAWQLRCQHGLLALLCVPQVTEVWVTQRLAGTAGTMQQKYRLSTAKQCSSSSNRVLRPSLLFVVWQATGTWQHYWEVLRQSLRILQHAAGATAGLNIVFRHLLRHSLIATHSWGSLWPPWPICLHDVTCSCDRGKHWTFQEVCGTS